jgi:ABC-type sulfate transport system permease component
LSLIVLIPLAAAFLKTSALTWAQFSHVVFSPQAMASYRLSFGASLFAALVNAVFGLIVAWVLVRYNFFGKRIVDALVDLPFALPTAVAGITLATLYAENGWIGRFFFIHQRLASLFSPAGNQDFLHAARHLCRAHFHRPAVRGADGPAGAGGF